MDQHDTQDMFAILHSMDRKLNSLTDFWKDPEEDEPPEDTIILLATNGGVKTGFADLDSIKRKYFIANLKELGEVQWWAYIPFTPDYF